MNMDHEASHTESPSSDEKKIAPSSSDPELSDNTENYVGALGVLQKVKLHDEHHPIHWPVWQKWVIISIYCLLQVFVTITSTSYVSAEFLIQEKFGGSTQVIALGQSLFIVGNAVGPAVLGPLSDIGGRKWVYVGSIAVYAILNIV